MAQATMQHTPVRHLSIRVPWHDAGWNGTVCKAPRLNGACLTLPRIAESRDDAAEEAVAGQSIADLEPAAWPCCIGERATFMAPFAFDRIVSHPYSVTSPQTHGNFAPTRFHHPAYSAAAVPFRWMHNENLEALAQEHGLSTDRGWEPDLGFASSWLQDIRHQSALLDCFFRYIKPQRSLCFFYAKRVPFVEESGRVIVGVGRVRDLGPAVEYKYKQQATLRSLIWERSVQHTIRPGFADGFLLPYHEALAHVSNDEDFDPSSIAAFAPADRQIEFSYASEHVTNDGAIAALLACASSLTEARNHLPGPWDACLRWIDERLNELWTMRGPCPGLGAALSAFGIELGTLAARELSIRVGENNDPWPVVDAMFADPTAHLPANLARTIDRTLQETWRRLRPERLELLRLLSRFELTPDQAKRLYVPQERELVGIACTDSDVLDNPYLVYELTRNFHDGVSVSTVDRGMFPPDSVREAHPLPERSALHTGSDKRRVRALAVERLEAAAASGHTLMAQADLIRQIRAAQLRPACEVTSDMFEVAESIFGGVIARAEMANESPAHQLRRLADMGQVIRNAVTRRRTGKRNSIAADWRALLDSHLKTPVTDEDEERARDEKAAALKELAEARISVLIGSAGTGKTTLLSVLCSHSEIAAGDVLLLAPTGKARVRIEQAATGLRLKAFTVAQWLSMGGRYDGSTQQYQLSDREAVDTARTVIVDEASMMTEEMLAALIDSVKGVHRLILVGDPRQLPPIGPGRPFVDIVRLLEPDNVEGLFPRVSACYAELTVHRRQAGQEREDLQLASWFSGRPLEPGEDSVFETVVKAGTSQHVRFVQWTNADEFHARLLEVIVEELSLSSADDVRGFDLSLGATPYNGFLYFNLGSASSAERWQVLSPVRQQVHGVQDINRLIHKTFRATWVDFARQRSRKIPRPLGNEEVVYGDKVINVVNHRRGGNRVYPQDGASAYIANGEIGIAVGQFKSPGMTKPPWELKVEFSSQPGYRYTFTTRDFDEDVTPSLELAYALTCHKAQGSEFDTVILVLPNPCRLLSRELLYTALTRQRNRVVVLHQGSRAELKRYASDDMSDTATRLTNLFSNPAPVEVNGRFLESRLIHRTCKGIPVRSKSEVIIYDHLVAHGITPSYERELTLGGVTKYPDFTIDDDETGDTYYWEHCGMLFDPAYRRRWENKKVWYRENGVLPRDEGGGPNGTLIITQDDASGGISSQHIDNLITEVFGV